jgi:hypothetical protein
MDGFFDCLPVGEVGTSLDKGCRDYSGGATGGAIVEGILEFEEAGVDRLDHGCDPSESVPRCVRAKVSHCRRVPGRAWRCLGQHTFAVPAAHLHA